MLDPAAELFRRSVPARCDGEQSARFARAAGCRCWSAERCCISAHYSTGWRVCRRPIRRCALSSMRGGERRLAGIACRARDVSIRMPRARIHPNDAQRIQRALEVHRLTGRPLSALQRDRPVPLAAYAMGARDRPATARFAHAHRAAIRAMMAAGFLDEVRHLRARGDLTADMPAMRAVGYRQLWQHLDGAVSASRRRCATGSCRARRQLAAAPMTVCVPGLHGSAPVRHWAHGAA